jgi:hypothetical protein
LRQRRTPRECPRAARPSSRVDRSRRAATHVLDGWSPRTLSAAREQNPAYRPARRIGKPLIRAFIVESRPKCPCGFPPLFHHAESSAFAQVSASQGSNGFSDVPGRTRFAAFRAPCEPVLEGLFEPRARKTAVSGRRAIPSGSGCVGPARPQPPRLPAAGRTAWLCATVRPESARS